ncbi:MAG: hypothetical protein BMS9Abin17_0311 [Acidimicrobiia bacterium]|nr:MAG: hypothetical protein BMS9Abin17_0311 [Acidimicrobiia bacterium]
MAEQQVLTVDGMSCTGCERRITSALRDVSGVTEALADHKAGTVTLAVGAEFGSPDVVRQTIEDLGYELVNE